MSRSKYSDSPLYMTTRELADLVIQALHEQNYFRTDEVAHPADIATAFSTVAETIGTAMSWAITQEHHDKKNAIMQTGDLRKTDILSESHDEIANENHYSDYKWKGMIKK